MSKGNVYLREGNVKGHVYCGGDNVQNDLAPTIIYIEMMYTFLMYLGKRGRGQLEIPGSEHLIHAAACQTVAYTENQTVMG